MRFTIQKCRWWKCGKRLLAVPSIPSRSEGFCCRDCQSAFRAEVRDLKKVYGNGYEGPVHQTEGL